MIEAAGSRYGPAAPLIDIDQVLNREEPFAFIGKPCDIAALRNFAEIDVRVNRLVRSKRCSPPSAPPPMPAMKAAGSTQAMGSRPRHQACRAK